MALYDISARLVLENVDSSSVERAISNINSRLEKGTRTAKTFSETITLKGTNLAGYTAIGAAIARLGMIVGSATHDAIRFDQELAKLAQTVGVSNKDIKEHAESIRNMSVAYGLSAPKIAETIRVLAQAGYSLREAKAAADELAKTTLLASFESISNTTEGLIAINKQFTETVGQSARVLSLLNVVAKKYAVESDDLVDAAKRAGGVFAATGGSLEQLVTIYTTVRDTTRESSETIATGLRTIFSRLQRPKTIDYLRQFGIELTDLRGNFIGNYEAILEIQKGIQRANIQPGSIQFAEIVEQLGGVLQQSRVIPLLTQGAKMQRIYADAQNASSETAADLAKAQETLAFKLSQTQQNFAKLIGDIMDTTSFKAMISLVLSLTNGFIGFANSIKELIPLIAALGAIKLARSAFQVLPNVGAGAGAVAGRRFASGGFVPGSGNGDTVPAMLTPGEFVIRKSAAQALGAEALHGINRYAPGGRVSVKPNALTSSELRKRIVKSDYTDEDFESGNAINDFDSINLRIIPKYFEGTPKMGNSAFEQLVATETGGNWTGGEPINDPNYPVDVIKAPGIGPIEARNRNKTTSPNELADKLIRYRIKNGENPLKNRNEKNEIDIGQITVAYNEAKIQKKRKASGGSISGTDTVPALLTPGEFVVNKKSAQAFGYGNLHKVNKYASGGVVGVQRFADGGAVASIGSLGGLADLGILVNQLIPSMTNLAATFTELTLVTSVLKGGLSSTGSALAGAAVNYVNAKKEEAAKIQELEKAYNQARATLTATFDEIQTAKSDLDRALGEINTQKDIRQKAYEPDDISASKQEQEDIAAASRIAKSSVSGKANTKLSAPEEKQAKADLKAAMKELTIQYGAGSKQVAEANRIIDGMKGKMNLSAKNVAIQAEAVKKYAELVDKGAVEQRELNDTLIKRQEAEAKAAGVARDAVQSAKGGISGKIKSTVSNLTDKGEKGEAARQTAQAGLDAAQMALSGAIAFFVSQSQTAADELQKLSDKAVASGNAQEAYDKSLAASAKAEEAASVKSATTAGASIGAVIGTIGGSIAAFLFPPLLPLIPIFTSLGSIVGEAIGAVIGFTGVITYITDLLGITDSKNAGKEKADAAAKAAAITEADKITNTALTKSAEFRKTDPNKADAILVKGVSDLRNLVQGTDKAGLAIMEKDIQDQARSLFDPLSASIEQLITKPENLGKSFDDLKRENSKLFKEWEYTGSIMKDGQEILKSQDASLRNTIAEQNKAFDAARNLTLVQLEQIDRMNAINSSLAEFDNAASRYSSAINGYQLLLSGNMPNAEVGVDLTDTSSRNRSDLRYSSGLQAAASLSQELSAEAAKAMRGLDATNNLENRLAVNRGKEPNKFSQDFQSDYRKELENAGLGEKTINAIMEMIDSGGDPIDIANKIRSEHINPMFKNLEEGRKAFNTSLKLQLDLLKEQIEVDRKREELMMSSLKVTQNIDREVNRLLNRKSDPDIERANRESQARLELSGTRSANVRFAGGGSIRAIGQALQFNQNRQQEINSKLPTAGSKAGELNSELAGLIRESEKLKKAMETLANTTEENAALEDKLKRSQESRATVREQFTSLAFGTRESNRDFFKTLNQARGVAATGNIGIVNESDRGNVEAILRKFENLPAFGGKTGKQVLEQVTSNSLRASGMSEDNINFWMAEMVPTEEKMLNQITENMALDKTRNDILLQILNAQSASITGLNNAVPPGGQAGFNPAGGVAQSYAAGGVVKGNSAKTTSDLFNNIFKPKGPDTVPAMMAENEFVVQEKYAKKNMAVLTAINSGSTKYLYKGTKPKSPSGEIYRSTVPIDKYAYEIPAYDNSRTPSEEMLQPDRDSAKARAKMSAADQLDASDATRSKNDAQVNQMTSQKEDFDAKLKKKKDDQAFERDKYQTIAADGSRRWFPDLTADNTVSNALTRSFKFSEGSIYNPNFKHKTRAEMEPKRSPREQATIDRGRRRQVNEQKSKEVAEEKARQAAELKWKLQATPSVPSNGFRNTLTPLDESQESTIKSPRDQDAFTNTLALDESQISANQAQAQDPFIGSQTTPYIRPQGVGNFTNTLKPANSEVKDKALAVKEEKMRQSKLKAEQRRHFRATGQKLGKPTSVTGVGADQATTQPYMAPQTPSTSSPNMLSGPSIPAQAINDFGSNSSQRPTQGSAGLVSGGRFNQAPQGASGSPTGQTGQAGQDFSSLTSSLEAFNTGFSTAVKELANIPMEFKHNITIPTMSITLNGAEFIASLPEAMKTAISEQITAQMDDIIKRTTESIANGGIGIFGRGKGSRRTQQAPA
jgi:TP901 family phage tail tape measure protein